jgi:diguanylate cyclase (GGDEF)-like protein
MEERVMHRQGGSIVGDNPASALADGASSATASSVGDRAFAGELAMARREIATLRSINARLVRQLAELEQREAHAQHLADRDGLTGLYNRRKMLNLLDSTLEAARNTGSRVGLLFIDLDGFKRVNDLHGHAAGDQLLVTVAARISARVRQGDLVCRYGGDEFVVILPNVADMSAVEEVAGSIARRAALPYRLNGREMRVTAAVGVAVYPDAAQTAEALLQRADQSMYRAKGAWTDPRLLGGAVPARRCDDAQQRAIIR